MQRRVNPALRLPSPFLVAALLAIGLAGGCRERGDGAATAAPADAAPDPIPVEVEHVTLHPVTPEVSAIGHLAPWRAVLVQAEAGGRVTALRVAEGDAVAEGGPLAALDRTLLEAQLRVARTAVGQARVAVRQATRERDRLEPLRRSGAIATARFDEADDALALARAALDSARARVALVERQIEDTDVVAPFAGVITEKHAEVGALVGPGGPLYTLQDLERLKVLVTFPPAALLAVGAGAPATIRAHGLGGDAVPATVHRIVDTADPKTGRVPVELAVARPPAALRPGLAVDVTLPVGPAEERVLAPRAAVVERFEAPYAFVVEDGRAVQRRLALGPPRGARVVIEQGLVAGDALVVAGQERLSDGLAVTVAPPPPGR